MPLSAGQILKNQYRIINLLGSGGFGAVYYAWDSSFDIPIAIKENTQTTTEAQQQFQKEAMILRLLRHDHLPLVTDYFVIPGQGQYLVMDYVDGENLEDKLLKSKRGLPEVQVLKWVEEVIDALTYIHGQDPPIIHRDIKPANIKINSKNEAVLVDFGIAKAGRPGLYTGLGAQAVTPGFSPLEQYGSGKTDARSDVYALGATLYMLLTNRVPPESTQRYQGAPLIEPRTINPSITIKTEQAILKAMELSPKERFQSAAELKRFLPVGLLSRTGKTARPSAKIISGFGALVFLFVVGLFLGVSIVRGYLAENLNTSPPRYGTVPIDTETDISSPTPPPEPSPTLVVPTKEMPTVDLAQRPIEPDQFIRSYFEAINSQQYELSWSMLSYEFKDKYHCCDSSGNYEFQPYLKWYGSITRIEILKISVQEQTGSRAEVYTLLHYYFSNGRETDDQRIFQLVSDGDSSWLINEEGG